MTSARFDRLYSCRPGREGALAKELDRAFPRSLHRVRSPGWVESALDPADLGPEPAIAFAVQVLPEPLAVRAGSIAEWARVLADYAIERLVSRDAPFRLHVFCADAPGGEVRRVRCERVREAALEILRRKQKRLTKTLVYDDASPFAENEWLIQAALEHPDKGFFSACEPVRRHALRRCLSRFEGGKVFLAEDKAPPSRAYLKLQEAELRLGRRIAPGELCVDLGAAPGGWTHVALSRGAHVVAVDRSPLEASLMASERLEFVKADAFRFEPGNAPVDWLLCDVIAFPARTIELLDRWLSRGLCRRFCATIKFRGEPDYEGLEALKAILLRSQAEFFLRELDHNKNEVTACGELLRSVAN